MNKLSDELQRLSDNNQDVKLVLDTYKEIEKVYEESLVAMGVTVSKEPEFCNTAKVTISFRSDSSSNF